MGRSAWCIGALAAAFVLLLALTGCGSSTTTPTTKHPPALASYWAGTVLDLEDPAHPYQSAQISLTLEQSGTGQLTGSATFCGGVYAPHGETDAVSGTVTAAAQVHLDISSYHLDGTYATASDHHLAMQGTFTSGTQVNKAVALTLLPEPSPTICAA